MKKTLSIVLVLTIFLCMLCASSLAESTQNQFTEKHDIETYSYCSPQEWKAFPDDNGKRFDYYKYDESGNLSAAMIVFLTEYKSSLYSTDDEATEQIDNLMSALQVTKFDYGKIDECPASFWSQKQRFAGVDDVFVTALAIVNRFSTLTVMYSHINDGDDLLNDEFAALTSTISAKQDLLQYSAGMYKVGTDIQPGEYLIINSSSSSKAYFGLYADSNGKKIIANDNFDFNTIITVKKGEYLDVKRGMFCLLDDFDARYTLDTSRDGSMFKIGVHLKPGEYKLVAQDGAKAYYCIYKDGRQEKILANDNFTGQSYVTVKKGQYLEIKRCTISK